MLKSKNLYQASYLILLLIFCSAVAKSHAATYWWSHFVPQIMKIRRYWGKLTK